MQPDAEVPQTTGGLENLPPLVVTVTDVNRHEHTNNVVSLHLDDAFTFPNHPPQETTEGDR